MYGDEVFYCLSIEIYTYVHNLSTMHEVRKYHLNRQNINQNTVLKPQTSPTGKQCRCSHTLLWETENISSEPYTDKYPCMNHANKWMYLGNLPTSQQPCQKKKKQFSSRRKTINKPQQQKKYACAWQLHVRV